MQSIILSNPIYQHSGESEKLGATAQQASINEDMEQRRRQLDKNGEKRKKLIANEVAHMVDEFGGKITLKSTPYEEKTESLISQAASAAADVGKSVSNTASSVSTATSNAVSSAASSAVNTGYSIFHSITSTVASLGHTAVDTVNSIGHTAADTVSSVSHAAQDATHRAVDSVTHAAQDVTHKAVDIAHLAQEKTWAAVELVENKAHLVAENISHFTTLVGVLAEEENERARRLVSGDESRAAANAFRVSALIRELDPCFYKQKPNLHYATKLLEESERRWRLNSANSQLAENNAHKEGKLVSSNMQSFMPRYQWVRSNINALEEKERLRRMNDSSEAWAMINAFSSAWLIKQLEFLYRQEGAFSKTHASYATTLLEENERRNRIRLDKLHRAGEDPAHHLMDVVSHNIEKFNSTTRNATRFASEFAHLVGDATTKVASQFGELTKDLANNAGTKVKSIASDLSNFSNLMYVIALEERERARRIIDSDELIAINNAWNQSQLIRSLPSYLNKSKLARYPLGMIEETERAWRIASIKPNASRFAAGIVHASLPKFEAASKIAGEREHAKDTAVHSRLNPNAPSFVPHVGLVAKVEPIVQPNFKASAAQL